MDKNLVAFLDEQAYTVDVQFTATGKLYKYVTNLPAIEPGSFVIIPVGEIELTSIAASENTRRALAMAHNEVLDAFGVEVDPTLVPSPIVSSNHVKIAQVVGVHDGVKIEPNESVQYKWVIARVDFTYFTDLCKRNSELQKLTEDAYKRNLRKSFAERIMGELGSAEVEKIKALVAPKKEK